jgi:hypothetical protein
MIFVAVIVDSHMLLIETEGGGGHTDSVLAVSYFLTQKLNLFGKKDNGRVPDNCG